MNLKLPKTKADWAKVAGWGQMVVTIANEVLATNGGYFPTSRAAWLKMIASFLLAGGIHHASDTSVAHPEGVAK